MTMISFNDFIREYGLKNRATSILKFQNILSSLSLSGVGIYLRDGPFSSDVEIVNLDASKGTHWVAYINEKFFNSYGCSPQKLSEFMIKRNGSC